MNRFSEFAGYAMSLIWIGFLIFPIMQILDSEATTSTKAWHLTIIATFVAVYVWGMIHALSRPEPFSDTLRPLSAVLVVVAAGIVLVAMLAGVPSGITLMIYLVALVVVALPPRIGYPLGAVTIAVFLTYSAIAYGAQAIALAIITVSVYVSVVGSSYHTRQANREITVGKREAVVDERERVARDVHDGLGHTLTVISLKSDLAAKLIDRDPERAKEEIAQVNDLSRQAIAEVRATVSGLSTRQLSTELAAAEDLAHEIGLDFQVAGEPEDVDPRHRILFGWVLREAMTNVIRHARASSVRVEMGDSHIRMCDDGVGFDSDTVAGHGLSGLRQRVEDAGGTMTVASSGGSAWLAPATGTTIEVKV